MALPHIGHDFGASLSALAVGARPAYLLALASLILLGGALGDRYGRRKTFLIGTIWFAGASLICGVAPNIEVLVVPGSSKGSAPLSSRPGAWPSCKRAFARTTARRPSGPGRAGGAAERDRTVRGRLAGRRAGLAVGVPAQRARGSRGRGAFVLSRSRVP